MKTCLVCQKEVTTQMVRHGKAISSGANVFHRECHRSYRMGAADVAAAPKAPARSRAPGVAPLATPGTSFPDIPEAVEYASFWRRFGAHIIDSFVLNVVATVLLFPMAGALGMGQPSLPALLGLLAVSLVPLAYWIVFWTRTGATPGKAALGIRVVSSNGGPVSGGQSFVRCIGYFFSSLVFCLGYLAMLWDDEKRCWHDRMAGTRVVKV
jgi:uncharacterized RDD family membrane protein YckC